MGAWGYESCSNDNTMDSVALHCNDTYNVSQEEVDACLKAKFTDNSEHTSNNVGLVIWFLQQDNKIPQKYLERCLVIIEEKLKETGNPSGWGNILKRKEMLALEKEIIESALSKDGYSSLEYETPLGDMLRETDPRKITSGENALKKK
jgi:hypothetical protein